MIRAYWRLLNLLPLPWPLSMFALGHDYDEEYVPGAGAVPFTASPSGDPGAGPPLYSQAIVPEHLLARIENLEARLAALRERIDQ